MTSQNPPTNKLILASSSRYRRTLLGRLNIEFDSISPDIDESQHTNESAHAYVQRLAEEKAKTIAKIHQDHLVIGSDQCMVMNSKIIGKPHTREAAINQLKAASGQQTEFLTGVCVMHLQSGWTRSFVEPFWVNFRALSQDEIERYVDIEKPLDCAGSFKSEGLGICLTQAMKGDDPTALVGLPLIKLAQLLREFGWAVP
jgi:MAF protein